MKQNERQLKFPSATIKKNRQKSRLFKPLILTLLVSLSTPSFADQSSMNATLAQIVQQLQQLTPLMQQAINQEPDSLKSSIHLTTFTDSNGNTQNGALEDLQALQSGLIAIINQNQIDPKTYAPITGDYIGGAQ